MSDAAIAWLRAQLDDDERVARTAANLQFDPENGWGTTGDHTVTPHIGQIHDDEARQHIVRWDPARVLAEIEAKRRILDLAEDLQDREGRYAEDFVRALAQPYADRDGFPQEWR